VERVVERLYSLKSIPLIQSESVAILAETDERTYKAGMLGTNYEGLYKPKV
jgi:hypothetical protein